jgi:hypothetical protein
MYGKRSQGLTYISPSLLRLRRSDCTLRRWAFVHAKALSEAEPRGPRLHALDHTVPSCLGKLPLKRGLLAQFCTGHVCACVRRYAPCSSMTDKKSKRTVLMRAGMILSRRPLASVPIADYSALNHLQHELHVEGYIMLLTEGYISS